MYETHEAIGETISMSFYYRDSRYTIEIDRYRYIIKCQDTGTIKPEKAFAKKISLSDRTMRYKRPCLRGARITNNYLIIYNSYDVIAIRLENLLRKYSNSVRSILYHVSKTIDTNDWENIPIVDVLHIKRDLIAVGLTDYANKQVVVAFIDTAFYNMRYTDKFGSDISLVKLAEPKKGRCVMALCDHGTNPWIYNPQMDIHGDLEIYTIDVESGIVVSKTTVN